MKQALGLVEIQGLSTAFVVADTMAKAANVRILEIENTRGLGYMTIKVDGNVGAVTAAVNAGKQIGIEYQKLVSWKVIPRPSDYVEHTFADPDGPGSVSPPGYRAKKQADKPQVSPEEDTAAKMEPLPQEVKEAAVVETAAEEVAEMMPEPETGESEVSVKVPEAAENAPEPEAEVSGKVPEAAEESEVSEEVPEAAESETEPEAKEPEVSEEVPEAAENAPEPEAKEPEVSEAVSEAAESETAADTSEAKEVQEPETAEEAPTPAAPEKSKAAPRKKASSSAKGAAGDKTGSTTRRKK